MYSLTQCRYPMIALTLCLAVSREGGYNCGAPGCVIPEQGPGDEVYYVDKLIGRKPINDQDPSAQFAWLVKFDGYVSSPWAHTCNSLINGFADIPLALVFGNQKIRSTPKHSRLNFMQLPPRRVFCPLQKIMRYCCCGRQLTTEGPGATIRLNERLCT